MNAYAALLACVFSMRLQPMGGYSQFRASAKLHFFSFSIIRTAGVYEATCAKFYGAQKRFKPRASRLLCLLSLMRASFYGLVLLIKVQRMGCMSIEMRLRVRDTHPNFMSLLLRWGVSDVVSCHTVVNAFSRSSKIQICTSPCLTALHFTA